MLTAHISKQFVPDLDVLSQLREALVVWLHFEEGQVFLYLIQTGVEDWPVARQTDFFVFDWFVLVDQADFGLSIKTTSLQWANPLTVYFWQLLGLFNSLQQVLNWERRIKVSDPRVVFKPLFGRQKVDSFPNWLISLIDYREVNNAGHGRSRYKLVCFRLWLLLFLCTI